MNAPSSRTERAHAPAASSPETEHARSKPAARAFVVQFDPIPGARSRLRGRAELVASGEATHFRSLQQLVDFMVTILRRQPGKGGSP